MAYWEQQESYADSLSLGVHERQALFLRCDICICVVCNRSHGGCKAFIYTFRNSTYNWCVKTVYSTGKYRDGSITIKDYAVGLLRGGFVFYGGVFGGLLSLVLVCRYFRYDRDSMFMVITPALPLAHAFGRVGCTVAGCCYGIETDGIISIVYHNSRYAPVGVRLFPVQLVEAAGDIVIFIILVYIILRNLNI